MQHHDRAFDFLPGAIHARTREFAFMEGISLVGATCSVTIFLRLICLAFEDRCFPRLPLFFFTVSICTGMSFAALAVYTYFQAITHPADTISTLFGSTWGMGNLTPVICDCASLSRIIVFYPRADPKKFRRGLLILTPSILLKFARLGCVINLCVYLQEVKNGARIITRPQTTSVTDGARPFMWVLAMVDALYSSGVLSYKLWQAGWSRPANNRNGLGRKLVAILRGAFIVSISSALPPTCLVVANVIYYFDKRGEVSYKREVLVAVWIWVDLVCLQYAFLWPHSRAASLRTACKIQPDRMFGLDRDVDNDLHGTRQSRFQKTTERSRCSVRRPPAIKRPTRDDIVSASGQAVQCTVGAEVSAEDLKQHAVTEQAGLTSALTPGSSWETGGLSSMNHLRPSTGRTNESDSTHQQHGLPIIDEWCVSSQQQAEQESQRAHEDVCPMAAYQRCSAASDPLSTIWTGGKMQSRQPQVPSSPPTTTSPTSSMPESKAQHSYPLFLRRAASTGGDVAIQPLDREVLAGSDDAPRSPLSIIQRSPSTPLGKRIRVDRPGSVQSTASIMVSTETCIVID